MSPLLHGFIANHAQIRVGISLDIQTSWNDVLKRDVLDNIKVDVYNMQLSNERRTRQEGGTHICSHVISLVVLH
jgi:hypothetical protein